MVNIDMDSSTISDEKNNDKIKWTTAHCTIQNAMDDTQFDPAATPNFESMKIFARRSEDGNTVSGFTSQDLVDALSFAKVSRTSLLSRVEIDPEDNQLKLKSDNTNIRSRYGYDFEKEAYVYPEEALYLLECGKAEIYCNHVSLSVQRARSLLLLSRKEDTERTGKIKYCTHEEYLVYKCLTRMGYALYRYRSTGDKSDDPEKSEENLCEIGNMEMDDDVIIEENQKVEDVVDDQDIIEVDANGTLEDVDLNTRKTFKRKLSEDDYEDEGSGSDDDIMDEYPGVHTNSMYFGGDDDNSFPIEPNGYTVDEADSDVEIVDEVIFSHGGVEIQEIDHSVGCQEELMEMSDEPVASTSRGPQVTEVVVDLVSSEDEDEDSKEFARKVWAKLIPNSKVFFKMPPSKLIPPSIPSGDKVYEFDLKDKSDISDLELEFLVDEVSLNDDRYGMCSPDSSHINLAGVKSWKEWRQNMFQEARNVMNNSLLASSEYINGEAATEKLFLWEESERATDSPSVILNKIVFEMYGPICHGYSRQKAFEGKPLYYILISRQDESVPDFGVFGSSINGVPILIAVVCDSGENDVLFMTADRSPLNSLF